jgi:uncharacterized membrane protein
MKTYDELKRLARTSLQTSYWYIFILLLVISAILGASQIALVGLVITGPIMVGYSHYLLKLYRQEIRNDQFDTLLLGFKEGIVRHIITYLIMGLFIFLWSLLFVIPGIIKAIAYSQVGFILAENPELEYQEALKRSEDMMRGHKWRYFELQLSFIGWYLLSILTFGIGFIFLAPYLSMTQAAFYDDLKAIIR